MKRFLLSRLSALGDVVLSLPAAGALKAAMPHSEIVWVVDRRFRGLVECCRHVDTIVEASPKLRPSTWPTLVGEFDAALDLQGLLKSAIPVWRAKAKLKLGFHWQREGAWLFSKRVRPDPTSLHITDQLVDVARAAGGVADRADFGLASSSEALKAVSLQLVESGVDGAFVAVNAGGAWASKRWPAASFAAVCDRLAEHGFPAVLIGSKDPAEVANSEALIAACRVAKPVSMVGSTSIKELIALIELSSAHLGGDTGSTHIAAALGKPAVGLYSVTKPERTGPYGQIARVARDPRGLAFIPPEAAAKVLLEALG